MFDIRSLTWDEWSYPEGVLLWGQSDPRIAELREMPQSFSIKLHSKTQVSGRLGMSWGISPRHAQNPLSNERRKTLSITRHALSPPPSHHHLYIFHLINWLQRFYRIIMSLKRPFVPKSDVKQWFTTTTTTFFSQARYTNYKYISEVHRAPFYQRKRYELVIIAHLHMRIVKFNEWFRVLVSSLYMLKRETYEENQRASIFS